MTYSDTISLLTKEDSIQLVQKHQNIQSMLRALCQKPKTTFNQKTISKMKDKLHSLGIDPKKYTSNRSSPI